MVRNQDRQATQNDMCLVGIKPSNCGVTWSVAKCLKVKVAKHVETHSLTTCLVVFSHPSEKIWKSIGMIIPNIWENKMDGNQTTTTNQLQYRPIVWPRSTHETMSQEECAHEALCCGTFIFTTRATGNPEWEDHSISKAVRCSGSRVRNNCCKSSSKYSTEVAYWTVNSDLENPNCLGAHHGRRKQVARLVSLVFGRLGTHNYMANL